MVTRKTTPKLPTWLRNLQQLLAEREMNPRQLSLLAGLNPTAVRDMLSGRARYPRYDTLQAIARVLGTTPAFIMGDATTQQDLRQSPDSSLQHLELLTEIIARLQETADGMARKLTAQELASMAATLYRQMLADHPASTSPATLTTQARTLVSYATLQTPQSDKKQAKRA